MPRARKNPGTTPTTTAKKPVTPESSRKESASGKTPSRTGALAMFRAGAKKALPIKESDWRVILDSEQLESSLPHIPTGSLVIDFLIGGEANQHGVRPCPGLPRGRVSQIWGHESAGKCSVQGTRVSTEKGILTIGEIFEVCGVPLEGPEEIIPISFGLHNRYGEVEKTTHFTRNGSKATRTLKTFSGGSIQTTYNHPHLVMSPNGNWVWKPTGAISPGDYLISQRGVGVGFLDVPRDEAYLVGLLLADGWLGEKSLDISKDDPDIVGFLEKKAPFILGVKPKTRPKATSSVNFRFNSKDTVATFYETWGWTPCNSPAKVVGPRIRRMGDESLVAVLQGYFDCECSVDVEKTCLEVTSASRELLDDIKLLLQLRFNIVGLVREKEVKAYPDNDYWRMIISGEEARRFIRTVGTRSTLRMEKYETLLCQPHDGGSTNHDSIPNLGGILRDLYDSAETNRELHHLMADYMGISPRANLTYDHLGKVLAAFGDIADPLILRRLQEIQEANYYYDRVEGVGENEPEPTFDFAMVKTASFNANGFVTHNTTLALTTAATTCANGGTVLYIDWENDIVPDYAAALGVPITDPDQFELAQPPTLEDGLKLAMIAAAAGVDLIVFDSVGSAVPRRIANRELKDVGEQSRVGELQAVWSQELPNLKRIISRKGGAILGISQIRAKISTGGFSSGPTTQPQGGNAWKFYASVRLELRRIKQEKTKQFNVLTHKTDDRVTGGVIRCKVIKCKLSRSQGREEVLYIRWGEGLDDMRSVLEIAVAHGIIQKGGAWFSWSAPSGEVKVQGVNAFRIFLEEHPDDFVALYNEVVPFLGRKSFAPEDLAEIDDVGALLLEIEGTSDSDADEDEEEDEEEDGDEDLLEDDEEYGSP